MFVLAEVFLGFSFLLARAEEINTEEIRQKIEKVEEEIDEKRVVERTIQDEISVIDKNMEAIKLQLDNSRGILSNLDKEIIDKTQELARSEKTLEQKKDMLGEYLRKIEQGYREQQIYLMSNSGNFEQYFGLLDSFEQMHEEVRKVMLEVKKVKDELNKERQALEDKRMEQYQVYLMQEDQRLLLDYEQQRKNRLLGETKKDISSLSVERDELRKQLNALQSLGNPINLDEAIEVANYASEKTGVRTAFLLGVLRVESNLGQNVGGGRYRTDMNPAQHSTFKRICKELALDPTNMPVSRRVCYNKNSKDGCGGWGGAMGPAQFMPNTWMAFRDRVSKATGHNPPNPWNLKDALVAMGLKLSDVPGVTSGKKSAERQAASMYLAGGNWQNYTWYGDRVLYYADGFERYMKN